MLQSPGYDTFRGAVKLKGTVVKSMAMEGLGYERRDADHIQNTAAPHSRVKR